MPRQRVNPAVWTPTPDPGFSGPFAKNDRLKDLELIDVGVGPEDVVVAPNGDVYCGIEDGRIMRLPADRARDHRDGAVTLCQTGGRVGGIEVVIGPDGEADHLIACDYYQGLIRVELPSGRTENLVHSLDGERLRFVNNCAVSPDGRIWFTASSRRWDLHDFRKDALEGTATGRLLVHDPRDGSTEVVLDHLAMSNGVAVTPDGTAVLCANSNSYDISRVWIAGPKAGYHDMFVEGLPCALDNLSVGTDGHIWAACVVPRNKLLDALSPKAPVLRRIAAALPERLVPAGPDMAWAIAFDPQTAEVVQNLQAWGIGYNFVTGVREHNGTLWLGGIHAPGLARIRL